MWDAIALIITSLSSIHGKEKFQCNQCCKFYSRQSKLKIHQLRPDRDEQRTTFSHSMRCAYCLKDYARAYILKRHGELCSPNLFRHQNLIWKTWHDDVIKWKHFPRYCPFVRGIHRLPANSPHKFQWRGALMFSLICAWINGWVNNRQAGDLRLHHGHRVHYMTSV